MAIHANDERCRAAAYHESAHIVIACFLGLPISPKGVCIDGFANGQAWFMGSTEDTEVALEEFDKVVKTLCAGAIAHRRLHCDIEVARIGDDRRIDQLFDDHGISSEERESMRNQLSDTAQEIVDEHWQEIKIVAEALWCKPWRYEPAHQSLLKWKRLNGSELQKILAHVPVVVDEKTE